MSNLSNKWVNLGLVLVGVFIFSLTVRAEFGAEKSAQEEFESKRLMNRARVENFYQRMIELDRLEAERRRGEDDMRKQRKSKIIEQEAARQEFVKNKKAKPQTDPRAWEAEIKERQLAYEKNRKDYVRRQAELRKLLKNLGQIPPEDEFEIDLESQTEN